jgi:predicted transcriptional regulator of viral defense system
MKAAEIRGKIPRDVFDYQTLVGALGEYRKPRDRIGRLLSDGTIVRIKKGLYCFGEDLRRAPICREQVANLMYGPSYVSMESALSYHGMIPERVEVVTSVTTRRSRRFDTALGSFSYRLLSGDRYGTGAALERSGDSSFLMATAEKALADKVWTDAGCPGRSVSGMKTYLMEDLRIDEEALSALERDRFEEIASAYRSAKIDRLIRCLEGFRGRPHA